MLSSLLTPKLSRRVLLGLPGVDPTPAPAASTGAAAAPAATPTAAPAATTAPATPAATSTPTPAATTPPAPTAPAPTPATTTPAPTPTARRATPTPSPSTSAHEAPTIPTRLTAGQVLAARCPTAPGLAPTTTAEWHVARRFAQMPNAALVAEIKAMGIGPWFEAQLLPETVPDPVWAAIEAKSFPWMSMTVSQQVAATGQEPWRCSPVLAQMLAVRPLYTKRVLQESMVELWSDQIYVARGGDLEMWVADFNHRVLRKHALGRFTDLLHAALTNPALLMYLNNDLNRKSGPNENLGRELLELYTVGVGNYTETDVVNSSIILTGHSIDWTTYDYSNAWWSHKAGPVRVMEFSHPNPPSKYDSQTSTAETNAALLKAYSDYLARHRKTAERIARRIAVRFVSDTPSAALVTHLADVYQQNDTAIVPVLRALFNHAEFAASAGLKWKRPLEHQGMLVAATRPKTFHPPYDFRVNPWWPGQLHDMIANAGQPLRMWPAVNGFPDVAAAWLSTASLLNGLNGTESEMEFWDESFDKVVWADALGVKAGMNVWAAADLIATTLTGFTWPRTHLAHIASYLAAHGDRPATDTDVVSADARRWYVPHVVRLVAMSPYAWMR